MINFPDYIKATNAAYDVLIQFGEFSLPICIFSVIKQIKNISLHRYTELAKRMNTSFNKLITEVVPSFHGFTTFNKSKSRYIIFYNDLKDQTTIRFTLAHELGHIILGHTKDGVTENREANCFARNFLCPVPIIEEMNLCSIYEYTENFYISELMAKVSINFKDYDLKNITTNRFNAYNNSVMFAMNGFTSSDLYGYSY